jgi:hypothetical protein
LLYIIKDKLSKHIWVLYFLPYRIPKQSKIILHRILRTESAKLLGKGDNRFLIVCLALQKAKVAGGATYVKVKGNKKRRWGDAFPEAQVYGAFAPHEPAKGKV